jgi:hypothetical protein
VIPPARPNPRILRHAVAIGKRSGTFSQPLNLPGGTVIPPTGKSFTTFFTTIARWQDDRIVQEYVVFDPDMMAQTTWPGERSPDYTVSGVSAEASNEAGREARRRCRFFSS